MKIAIVVQRYGADISGGAELHARYIAEHLARHVDVEVLTTCATDYITWRNSMPAGTEKVHGISVRRFPVERERDPAEFAKLSERVFTTRHSLAHELAWLDAEGPNSPELIKYIGLHKAAYDFFIFFSFRYYQAYHGARAVPDKAILVPTAERDAALGLAMFNPVFRAVRAVMYNSFEERALIQAASNNADVPGVVVGVGSEIPAETHPARFRQKFNFRERFAIYVGRIDENKGCAELFQFFEKYSRMLAEGMHLVLIGTPVIRIPDHPRIHHLGYVSDQDKFDALAAAELLIMPSYLESLSMVALEAWALDKPVLANGRCDVLKGQCIRSNGGLYYESFEEFIETLRAIDMSPVLATTLGRNGREYFRRHYAWPVIEQHYLDMLQRLAKQTPSKTLEPLPGWFARRRSDLPPANEVLQGLPSGPAIKQEPEAQSVRPTPVLADERRPTRSDRPPERTDPGPRREPFRDRERSQRPAGAQTRTGGHQRRDQRPHGAQRRSNRDAAPQGDARSAPSNRGTQQADRPAPPNRGPQGDRPAPANRGPQADRPAPPNRGPQDQRRRRRRGQGRPPGGSNNR